MPAAETACTALPFARAFDAAGRKGGTRRVWVAAVAPLEAEVVDAIAAVLANPKARLSDRARGVDIATGSTRALAVAALERRLAAEARYLVERTLCAAPAIASCVAADEVDARDVAALDGDDFFALLVATQTGETGAACA